MMMMLLSSLSSLFTGRASDGNQDLLEGRLQSSTPARRSGVRAGRSVISCPGQTVRTPYCDILAYSRVLCACVPLDVACLPAHVDGSSLQAGVASPSASSARLLATPQTRLLQETTFAIIRLMQPPMRTALPACLSTHLLPPSRSVLDSVGREPPHSRRVVACIYPAQPGTACRFDQP